MTGLGRYNLSCNFPLISWLPVATDQLIASCRSADCKREAQIAFVTKSVSKMIIVLVKLLALKCLEAIEWINRHFKLYQTLEGQITLTVISVGITMADFRLYS